MEIAANQPHGANSAQSREADRVTLRNRLLCCNHCLGVLTGSRVRCCNLCEALLGSGPSLLHHAIGSGHFACLLGVVVLRRVLAPHRWPWPVRPELPFNTDGDVIFRYRSGNPLMGYYFTADFAGLRESLAGGNRWLRGHATAVALHLNFAVFGCLIASLRLTPNTYSIPMVTLSFVSMNNTPLMRCYYTAKYVALRVGGTWLHGQVPRSRAQIFHNRHKPIHF